MVKIEQCRDLADVYNYEIQSLLENKMNIITDTDKLSVRVSEIDVRDNKKLIGEIANKLEETMKEHNIRALAASQIGYDVRMFCIEFKTKKGKSNYRYFINPIIGADKGFTLVRQSDPSLPGKEFIHPRSNQITLMYQSLDGHSFGYDFVGLTAFTMQQMVDLLDGVMLDELGLEIDERFDQATESEKNDLLLAYSKMLGERKKLLDEDINSNSELKMVNDAIKFMKSVQSGETRLGEGIRIDE